VDYNNKIKPAPFYHLKAQEMLCFGLFKSKNKTFSLDILYLTSAKTLRK